MDFAHCTTTVARYLPLGHPTGEPMSSETWQVRSDTGKYVRPQFGGVRKVRCPDCGLMADVMAFGVPEHPWHERSPDGLHEVKG